MDFHGMIVHFFLLLNILLAGRTSLLIHETTKGNLACFHVLTIMNKASKNTLVQVLLWTFSVHSGKYQGVKTAE